MSLIDAIDKWLPQTQCQQCGYPRCRDYAEALAAAEAEINRCPPGNTATINGLTDLLGKDVLPLDESCGQHKARTYVIIDESLCIGCTLCIKACPVDAIMGSAKRMHTILIDECTGCDLCIPPCPMDCILIKNWTGEKVTDSHWPEYSLEETDRFRRRSETRLARLKKQKNIEALPQDREQTALDEASIQADIVAAVKRVKNKRLNNPS